MSNMLAIIPARGGSKGIPFKNMRKLGGIPLIGHTIRAALASKYLSKIIVSTDSQEIADFATKIGVATNHLRPEKLAEDSTTSVEVLEYEISKECSSGGAPYEHVVLLQPTSPFRVTKHIDEAVSSYLNSDADSLISVCDVGAGHPDYMYRCVGDYLEKYLPSIPGLPRQKLEKFYLRNGAIYISSIPYFKEQGRLVSPNPIYYLMDRKSSVNIDEPEDLLMAEALIHLDD